MQRNVHIETPREASTIPVYPLHPGEAKNSTARNQIQKGLKGQNTGKPDERIFWVQTELKLSKPLYSKALKAAKASSWAGGEKS